MPESFEISVIVPANASRVYRAWLSSAEHAAMIQANASILPQVGTRFSMWDGYIEGENIELELDRRILQAWRTTEFPSDSPDSQLEILFEELEGGTKITLIHRNLPDGQGQQYKDGWQENYFEPMKEFFSAS